MLSVISPAFLAIYICSDDEIRISSIFGCQIDFENSLSFDLKLLYVCKKGQVKVTLFPGMVFQERILL